MHGRRFIPSNNYGAIDVAVLTGLINAGAELVTASGDVLDVRQTGQYQKALAEQQAAQDRLIAKQVARQAAIDARETARTNRAAIQAQARVAAQQAAQPFISPGIAIGTATILALAAGAIYLYQRKQ
jgi:hypothetical protein